MADQEYRIEHDTMGEVKVPVDALWRAQTQRAVENFPISGRGLESQQIRALGLLKAACAQVNKDLGNLDAEKAIVAKLNRIALENVVYAPTGFFLQYQAWRRNVSGVQKGPLPFFWGVSKT